MLHGAELIASLLLFGVGGLGFLFIFLKENKPKHHRWLLSFLRLSPPPQESQIFLWDLFSPGSHSETLKGSTDEFGDLPHLPRGEADMGSVMFLNNKQAVPGWIWGTFCLIWS